jgi:hypothetical protein
MAMHRLKPGDNGPVQLDGKFDTILVEGDFRKASNVSTALELNFRERQADGSFKRGVHLRTILEPGEYVMALGVGELSVNASGPDSQPWWIAVDIFERPKAPKQPTAEQRLAALELAARSQPDAIVPPSVH